MTLVEYPMHHWLNAFATPTPSSRAAAEIAIQRQNYVRDNVPYVIAPDNIGHGFVLSLSGDY